MQSGHPPQVTVRGKANLKITLSGVCVRVCVPGDGSKHVGDRWQADFERVQLTHHYSLQVQPLQVLQT